jgi:single-strand DNA-binding protein
MSASLNRVILIGNLTADPELRYTPGGTARVRFSIALNRQFKDASGKLQDEVTFVPIVVWGTQAENCANYLRKGRSIAVEGRLRIDSFENADGERVRVTEVVASTVQFLGGGPQRTAAEEPAATPEATGPGDDSPLPEEEVPF